MPIVMFREADQRVGRYHFEVLTSVDGMVSKFHRTEMRTDEVVTVRYTGETSCQDAMRQFTDEVMKEMY